MAMNRNKRSIVIDFKKKSGIEIMKRLAKNSDVIIENYRTGAMDKLGLGYEDLKKVNDKIIYCSISGFGRTGPYSKRAGFDLVAQGMSGLMSFTGEPGSPPVKVGVPIADLNAGMFATYGILTSYINMLKTGKGQYLETSLLESAIAYTVWESSSFFATQKIPEALGSSHRLSAPYQALRTSDGYINIGAPNQSNWERLCKTIKREDLIKNEKFLDNSLRLLNREILEKELESTLKQKNSNDWLDILEKEGVPAGPILNMSEVWSNEQVKFRDMDVVTEHSKAGQIHNIGIPVKLKENPGEIKSAAPILGENTREILFEIGYSNKEINDFIESQVVSENK